MIHPLERLKTSFSVPIIPPVAIGISRTHAGGIRLAKREKKIAGQFVLPLPGGCLEPSFDKKNVLDAAALEGVLRQGQVELGPEAESVGLLIPETCTRVFLLTFESFPSSPAERRGVLEWRLNKLLPLNLDELRISYDVIRSSDQTKVFLAAARTAVIQEYEGILERLGLRVRTIGIPVFNLLGLVRLEAPGHTILVNIEEEYVSLLAVLGGEPSLYRFKPYLKEPGDEGSAGRRMVQVITEIENTVNFIEDREKKKIGSLWVRAVVERAEGEVLTALRDGLPALQINGFTSPWPLRPQDQPILSPLVGQLA